MADELPLFGDPPGSGLSSGARVLFDRIQDTATPCTDVAAQSPAADELISAALVSFMRIGPVWYALLTGQGRALRREHTRLAAPAAPPRDSLVDTGGVFAAQTLAAGSITAQSLATPAAYLIQQLGTSAANRGFVPHVVPHVWRSPMGYLPIWGDGSIHPGDPRVMTLDEAHAALAAHANTYGGPAPGVVGRVDVRA